MRTVLLAMSLCLAVATGAGAVESRSYEVGYSLGCFNGTVFAGSPSPAIDPDQARMTSDADYARGYREGVQQCYIDTLNTMGGRLGGGGGGR